MLSLHPELLLNNVFLFGKMQLNILKSKIFFFLRVVLSCAILFYLVTFLDWERIKGVMPQLRLEYIWQGFICLFISIFIMSIRWSVLLHQFSIKQSIMDSWRFYLIGFFYGILLPGVVGGDIVRLGLSVKEHRGGKTFLATSVFFERSCGLLVILMIAAVAVLLSPSLLQGEPVLLNSISIFALVFILIFFIFFVAIKFIPDGMLTVNIDHGKTYSTLIDLLHHFKRMSFKVIILILSLSFLAHAMDILGSYYLAKALHINQPLSFFFIVIPVVYMATLLPISLGGLGIREGVLAFLLINAGVPGSDAVLLGFLIYINRVVFALLGGGLHMFGSCIVSDAK